MILLTDEENLVHNTILSWKIFLSNLQNYAPTITYSAHLATYLRNKFLDYVHTSLQAPRAYAVYVVENKAISQVFSFGNTRRSCKVISYLIAGQAIEYFNVLNLLFGDTSRLLV